MIRTRTSIGEAEPKRTSSLVQPRSRVGHSAKTYVVGFLVVALVVLAGFQSQVSDILGSTRVAPTIDPQQSTLGSPYVSMIKLQNSSSDPLPWVLYPWNDKSAIVVAFQSGIHYYSEIVNVTIGAPPKVLLTLRNAEVTSVIVDKAGKVWFPKNNTLSYYDPALGPSERDVATYAQGRPQYLAIDGKGRVWVTLPGSYQVARYDPSNNEGSRTFPVSTPNSIPQGITAAPDGSIWFWETDPQTLVRMDPDSGTITEYRSTLQLVAPLQLTVDRSGVVWFTDHGTNEFGSFNPQTGEWVEYPVGYCTGSCSVGVPNAIAPDGEGNIWFSEHISGRIARYQPGSGLLTEYAIPAPPGAPNTSFPFSWWAQPGPNNLTWFTAYGYGEVGFVNASVPLPFTVTMPRELAIQRGWYAQVELEVDHPTPVLLGVGVSTSTLEVTPGGSKRLQGSTLQGIKLGSGPSDLAVSISSIADIASGPYYATVSVSNGPITVSVPVKVTIVEPVQPYLSIGLILALAATSTIFYLRLRKIARQIPQALQSNNITFLADRKRC